MPSALAPLAQALPSGFWVALLVFAGVLALVVGVLAFARHADEVARDSLDRPGMPAAPSHASTHAPTPLAPGHGPATPSTPRPDDPVQRAAEPAFPSPAALSSVDIVVGPSTAPLDVPVRPVLLVADDSAVARAKLRRLLEGAGYEVDLAHDGAQALDMVAGRPYAVLITDLEMPVLDGFQLIAHVQGSLDTEDLPVIAITGHEELSARVNDCQGLYGIFKKPWNDRELLKRVNAVAALRATHAGA